MSVPEHLICYDRRVFDHEIPANLDDCIRREIIIATGTGSGDKTFSQSSISESDFSGLDKRAYNVALHRMLSDATEDYGYNIFLYRVVVLNQKRKVHSSEPLVGDVVRWPVVNMDVQARIYLNPKNLPLRKE